MKGKRGVGLRRVVEILQMVNVTEMECSSRINR